MLLRDFNMTAKPGAIIAMIGANGAGKSSLMRVLNGLQVPNSGTVKWNGRNLQELPRSEKAKTAGSIYSEFVRVEGFTVYDLVALGRSGHTGIFGKLHRNDRFVIEESIHKVRLETFTQKEVATLSDGEFRRALLAKLLAQQTEILFLDEPTAHLDLPSAVEFVGLLKGLANQGKTIILSTHHLPIAFKMADQVILLNGKGSYALGSPEEIHTHSMLNDFLPSEKIKLVDGNLILDL